jgi:hypothetical protein
MDPERILFVLRLPARLTVLQVAILLNFHADAIYYFVKIGLLEPIGEAQDVQFYFDAQYVNQHRYNSKWLRKATNAWRTHTQNRTAAQKAARAKKGGKSHVEKPIPVHRIPAA